MSLSRVFSGHERRTLTEPRPVQGNAHGDLQRRRLIPAEDELGGAAHHLVSLVGSSQ